MTRTGQKLCRHLQEQKWPMERHKNSLIFSPSQSEIHHCQTGLKNKHVASLRAVKPPRWFLYQEHILQEID